jgi:hypothetical protein
MAYRYANGLPFGADRDGVEVRNLNVVPTAVHATASQVQLPLDLQTECVYRRLQYRNTKHTLWYASSEPGGKNTT